MWVSEEHALIILDEVLISWLMKSSLWIKNITVRPSGLYSENMKNKFIYVLGVPDRYKYMDPELQKLILKYYNDAKMLEETKGQYNV